jgi:glycerophosphoryl diester phosphodiesterase
MTKIVGHRGAAGLALENTVESVKAALELPVSGIEIDVRRTQDGQLVLMHDAHTGHVSGRTLLIQNSTLAQLRELELHNGETIPTLEEIFKLIDDRKPIMLDIKSSGTSSEILRLSQKYPKTNIYMSGRRYEDLKRLHEANRNIHFLIQHHFDPLEIVARAKALGAMGICLNMWLMNPLTYRLARRQGLEVYVYTINHRLLLKFFQKLYPEVVIISNHPERLL